MAAGRIGPLLWLAAVLLPAALFFSVTSDLPHVFVLTLLIFALDLAWRRPFPPTDRSVIYSVVAVGVLTVLGDYLFPLKAGRFGFLSIFLRPQLLIPALLYAAAFGANFERNPWKLGLCGAAALAALAFGGDIRGGRGAPAAERLIGSESLLAVFPFFYGAAIVVTVLLFLLASRRLRGCKGGGKLKFSLTLAAILLVPAGVGGLYALYRRYERGVRQFELMLLRTGFRSAARFGGNRTVFGREVNLNATLDPGLRRQGKRIAFRVVAPVAPGYLRGRVFTVYRNGVWSNPAEAATRSIAGRAATGLKADKLFLLRDTPPGKTELEILSDSALLTDILFFPGHANALELIADRLAVSPDGVVEATEFQRDGGLTAHLERPRAAAASQWSRPVDSELYRAYPADLARPLAALDRSVVTRTPKNDAALFADYLRGFSGQFQYTLDFRSGGGDPVEQFLTRDRAGHCELFASALTLALRRRGIPARYVTGFVCVERHPSGNYFLSRMGDAHAWVEAYNRQTRRWVVLDPTPPSSTEPAAAGLSDRVRLWSDWGRWLGQRLLGDLRRGRYAEIIAAGAVALGSGILNWLADPLRCAGTLLLLALPLWKWLRGHLRRRASRVRPELRALFRRYRKYHRIPGDPGAAELLAAYPDDRFLRLYQVLRFRARTPAAEEILELQRLLKEYGHGA